MLVAQPRPYFFRRSLPPQDMAETTPVREMGSPRVRSARAAGAAFVRGSTLGWTRHDLANWLVCQYAPCAMPPTDEDRGARPPALERTLDDGIFARVILDAHDRVLRLLSDLALPLTASPIARIAVASGMVARRRGADAPVEHAAVALSRLRIHERVESLFVADYLNRPLEYARLRICRDCGELSFTGVLEHAGWCEATPSQC